MPEMAASTRGQQPYGFAVMGRYNPAPVRRDVDLRGTLRVPFVDQRTRDNER